MSVPAAAAAQAESPRYTARLLIGCADRPGIVAAVSRFLFEQGANIVSSHQYSSDPSGGRFFLRTEFFLDDLEESREGFKDRFQQEVAAGFEMDWEIRWWGERRRVAIMVSRHDHCLVDLLWRSRRGDRRRGLEPPRPRRGDRRGGRPLSSHTGRTGQQAGRRGKRSGAAHGRG
jgi:formyltetrahydrofolate deformylase